MENARAHWAYSPGWTARAGGAILAESPSVERSARFDGRQDATTSNPRPRRARSRSAMRRASSFSRRGTSSMAIRGLASTGCPCPISSSRSRSSCFAMRPASMSSTLPRSGSDRTVAAYWNSRVVFPNPFGAHTSAMPASPALNASSLSSRSRLTVNPVSIPMGGASNRSTPYPRPDDSTAFAPSDIFVRSPHSKSSRATISKGAPGANGVLPRFRVPVRPR